MATLAAQGGDLRWGSMPSCCSPPTPSRGLPGVIEGQGLNPLLQDPGLAFHPPTLYAGYVGMSAAFSFAVGALVTRNVGRGIRPRHAAVDSGRVDAPDHRHHRWVLLGLLHARLGRLVVLGSGRECLA